MQPGQSMGNVIQKLSKVPHQLLKNPTAFSSKEWDSGNKNFRPFGLPAGD